MRQKPNTRKYKILFLLLICPLFFFGQSLTGLWTGSVSTDSNTVRKDQLFEIALTEYRGKVYGYSRSEFIVNDTLYYILKRVKGTINGDICEVVDDEIIAFNFPGKLDKGVKVTSTFKRNKTDSSWYLAGTWKTNATKKYYSLSGKVDLQEEKDLTASKIFPHLEELKVADKVAFYKERKEGVPIVMKRIKPEQIRTEYYRPPGIEEPVVEKRDIALTDIVKPVTPVENKTKVETKPLTRDSIKTELTSVKPAQVEEKKAETIPVVQKEKEIVKTVTPESKPTSVAITDTKPKTTELKEEKKENIVSKVDAPVVKETKPIAKTEIKEKPAVNKPIVKENPPITKVETKEKTPVVTTVNKEAQPVVKTETRENKPVTTSVVTAPEKKATVDLTGKTVIESKKLIQDLIEQNKTIGGRTSEFSQEVVFSSDSLELSLYDNGEIDGDTVSVFVNGEMIMARQGLKASAIKKTIYIKPGDLSDFTLVLFADNLGKYPPNTGLLVVHDGEDIYHLRFSSDLQKSSGIVFKRKK